MSVGASATATAAVSSATATVPTGAHDTHDSGGDLDEQKRQKRAEVARLRERLRALEEELGADG